MLTNRFQEHSLPCVCISGPPHRLLWRERKSFVNILSLYHKPFIHVITDTSSYRHTNCSQITTGALNVENKLSSKQIIKFSLSIYRMLLAEDALTLSYNPKDLKFIHHITDVSNLHQVKRWRDGACLGREEWKADGWDRNLHLNGSLQQNFAPGWS